MQIMLISSPSTMHIGIRLHSASGKNGCFGNPTLWQFDYLRAGSGPKPSSQTATGREVNIQVVPQRIRAQLAHRLAGYISQETGLLLLGRPTGDYERGLRVAHNLATHPFFQRRAHARGYPARPSQMHDDIAALFLIQSEVTDATIS